MKLKITLISLLFTLSITAQNGVNYKALIKDTNGNVLANQTIDFQFSIQFSGGTIFYEEDQTATTDQNGIARLEIGEGTSTLGDFATIPWERANVLHIQIDLEQDGTFVDFGNEPISVIPRSFYASRAGEADNIEGLVNKDEGNGLGWRLRDIGNNVSEGYAPIGLNAIDLSVSDADGALIVYPYGASGSYAFAAGESTYAGGSHSIAMGRFNVADGDYSTIVGRSSITEGDYSFIAGQSNQITSIGDHSIALGEWNSISTSNASAIGSYNEVSGLSSAAIGYDHMVSGAYSSALGIQNEVTGSFASAIGSNATASGFGSVAIGTNIVAPSSKEVVIGSYNDLYTPSSSTTWNLNDRLFVVGNGYDPILSPIIRQNAMTILKSGFTGIGTDNPQERLHIANGRLRIGSETIEDTGSNQLSFNASLLPDGDNIMRLGSASNRWVGVWATDGTINTSDRREKKNIKALQYGLDEVLQMQPVSFNWKSNSNPDTKLGLIAQDLQYIVPEVVKSHSWETNEATGTMMKKELERLGVYYSDLVPVLINAVKEQQAIIEAQSDRIEALENLNKAINELTAEIETIKATVSGKEQSN
ncbi:MAG: tail fiber domain-containing protein [Bacteroidota bacterium]